MTITIDTLIALHKIIPSFVVDIGGYEGEYAKKMYDKYKCKIKIFEPVPEYFKKITELFSDNDDIGVSGYALGKEEGKRKFYTAGASSSLSKEWAHDGEEIEVYVKKLSDFISHYPPDILKLNCEGAEYEILDDLDEHDIIKEISEILIQFHKTGSKKDYVKMLSKTHYCDFDYKWQLWRKKDATL